MIEVIERAFGKPLTGMEYLHLPGSDGKKGWTQYQETITLFADAFGNDNARHALREAIRELNQLLEEHDHRVRWSEKDITVRARDIGGASWPQIDRASCTITIAPIPRPQQQPDMATTF